MTLRGIAALLSLTASAAAQMNAPDRTLQYRPGDWTTWSMTRVASSVDLDDRMVYIGTTGGIGRYDYYRNEWAPPMTVSDGMTGRNVRALAWDTNSGYLWAATEDGVNARIPGSEEWRFLDGGPAGVSGIGVGDRFVWFRSPAGLTRIERNGYDPREGTEEECAADRVQWRGGEGKGLDLPDAFMDHPLLFTPPDAILDGEFRRRFVTASADDGFHFTWVTTDGLGLGRADRRTLRLDMLPFGLFMPDARFMAMDGDCLWVGGRHAPEDDGGVTRWTPDRNEWDYFEARYTTGMRSDQVTCISPDRDCVWFGTSDGLVRYDREKAVWNAFGVQRNLWSDGVLALASGDSVLWIGTDRGLNRVSLPDLVIDRVRDPRLDQRAIFGLADDGESVWIAAERGAFRLRKADGAIEGLAGYAGMSPVEARAVSVWRDEVWFATDDGVEMLNPQTGEWTGFSKRQYPTGGGLNCVAADSEAVWVGTEQGVLKYLKSENRWRRFTTADGLPDDSVRWIVPDGDAVWFATGAGITRFLWNTPYRID
jgi:hypothetical protein